MESIDTYLMLVVYICLKNIKFCMQYYRSLRKISFISCFSNFDTIFSITFVVRECAYMYLLLSLTLHALAYMRFNTLYVFSWSILWSRKRHSIFCLIQTTKKVEANKFVWTKRHDCSRKQGFCKPFSTWPVCDMSFHIF